MARFRGARRWPLAGVLVVASLTVSGCSVEDVPRFGWPSAVTDQGKRMQHFWSFTVIAALAVGVIVWALMFWTFAMHRKRKNSPLYPKQTKENLPLEIGYTVFPFLLVAFLFFFTVNTENYANAKTATPDYTYDVNPFKWAWDFGYQGTKDPSKANATASANEVRTVGTTTEVPILMLPVNKTVDFRLESRDVIHSFWVPDFVEKRDVFPNPEKNGTDYNLQVRVTQTGAFVGRCAELCGTYHSAMNFEVRAVPQNVYDTYLSFRQQLNPATGTSYTTSEALKATAAKIPDCGQLCSERSYTTYPINPERDIKTASLPPAGDS